MAERQLTANYRPLIGQTSFLPSAPHGYYDVPTPSGATKGITVSMDSIHPLFRGVGKPIDVLGHITNLPACDKPITERFTHLNDCLTFLLKDDATKCAALALVASHLNVSYRETGRLWSCRDGGTVSYDYISNDTTKVMIADLAGL